MYHRAIDLIRELPDFGSRAKTTMAVSCFVSKIVLLAYPPV